MKKEIVTVSLIAKNKLCEIMKKQRTNYMLLSVKNGGCNGFNYELQPVHKEPKKTDDTIVLDEQNKLIICSHSVLYLVGLHIDYSQNILSNEFVFNNPNASNHCGCGKSFC